MTSPFWRDFSFPSPVDDILKKPSFTLEELLDEDDVVVDSRSQKEELKQYLMRRETLTKLLKYVVEEQPAGASEAARMRYPVLVCEILTAEIDELEREIVTNDELLFLLFDFFKTPKINLLLATLVAKIIGTLMNTKLPNILAFLKKNPDIITVLINQIHCAIVTDILVRLITAESEYEGKGVQQWLVDIGFVNKLVNKFEPSNASVHPDVSNSICEVLACLPPLAICKAFLERKTVQRLFSLCFDPNNGSALRWGMTVVLSLLRIATPDFGGVNEGQPISLVSPLTDLQPVIQVSVEHLNQFLKVLVSPPEGRNITNQNGHETEAFGFHRLVILQCIDALINSGFTAVLKEIASNVELSKHLVTIFSSFPTNNFCHRFTEHILLLIISHLPDEQLATFFSQSNLLNFLVAGEKENRDKVERGEMRLMYIPFIFSIGSLIQERANQEDSYVSKSIQKTPDWDVLQKAIMDEKAKTANTVGPYEGDSDSEEPYNPSVSEDENDLESDEPNDADDYDTDQAEILLSKAEIEAIA